MAFPRHLSAPLFAFPLALLSAGCPQGPSPGPDNFCAGGNLVFSEVQSPTAMGDAITGSAGVAPGARPRPWLVTLRPGVLPPLLEIAPSRNFEGLGVRRYDSLDTATVQRLLAHPAVAALEEDLPRHTRGVLRCDPVLPGREDDPWYASDINVSSLWSLASGSGVLVAVLDTGIDATHPDLVGAVEGGTNVSGTGDLASFNDDAGHGTQVAGVLAARRNGQGIVGIAPGARLLSVKTQDAHGEGTVSTMIAGLQYAMAQNAVIANISVGAAGASYAELRAVDSAAARGMVLVAAAGNGGDTSAGEPNFPEYPASYRNVISVAATDSAGNRAPFSTFNAMVDLAAPGTPIMAPHPTALGNGSYLCDEGTSFSAPQVAAVAALLKEARPEANADAIRRALVCSATDATEPGLDAETGYGIVNATAALAFLEHPTP